MNDAFWLTLDQENPFSSREEGLAAVALAAREATVLLGEEGSGLSSGFTAGDVGDKLKRALKRVWDLANKVAAEFHASGFSVTVGLPVGVIVTFEGSSL